MRILTLLTLILAASTTLGQTGVFPQFRMQEFETKLKVGYAVLLADINGDGKPDIVVVDTTRVVWYENPTWKKRTIIEGITKPDNVCIDAFDIDGDGKLDLVLGAAWKPFEPTGTLQWLKRGKTLDEPWSVHPIDQEPSVHRVRFIDLYGTGKPYLVLGPLMGKGATGKNNYMDGDPVRMIAYKIPKDPVKDPWKAEVLDKSLHVVHNFYGVPAVGRKKGMDVLCASYEGVSLLSPQLLAMENLKWTKKQLGTGNQDTPKAKRGASEIKQGTLKNGKKFIATIEPWHGDQVVVYTEPAKSGALWDRHVIDAEIKWGHAVWCADLDGDGTDELIIGVRGLSDKNTATRGLRVYKVQDDKGAKWARTIVDDGGIGIEDLACVDLDGDGKIDIVAVGRFTFNARIYWNLGTKK
jgi:hypothetical protein